MTSVFLRDHGQVIEPDRLGNAIGSKMAEMQLTMKADPETGLLFALPAAPSSCPSPNESTQSEVIFTEAEWTRCLSESIGQVPNDVLLRMFGPDVG